MIRSEPPISAHDRDDRHRRQRGRSVWIRNFPTMRPGVMCVRIDANARSLELPLHLRSGATRVQQCLSDQPERLDLAGCVAGLVCAVTLAGVATAQPPEQSPYEQIQALDRRSVELLKNLSKHGEAQSLAQQALDIAERSSGRDSVVVAQRLDNLAFTIRIQHRYDEAEPLLVRALSIREKLSVTTAPTCVRA